MDEVTTPRDRRGYTPPALLARWRGWGDGHGSLESESLNNCRLTLRSCRGALRVHALRRHLASGACAGTLQACIDAAAAGRGDRDRHHGAPINESPQVNDKSLTLRPAAGFAPVFSSPNSIFVFGGDVAATNVVEGMTIANGRLVAVQGARARSTSPSAPTSSSTPTATARRSRSAAATPSRPMGRSPSMSPAIGSRSTASAPATRSAPSRSAPSRATAAADRRQRHRPDRRVDAECGDRRLLRRPRRPDRQSGERHRRPGLQQRHLPLPVRARRVDHRAGGEQPRAAGQIDVAGQPGHLGSTSARGSGVFTVVNNTIANGYSRHPRRWTRRPRCHAHWRPGQQHRRRARQRRHLDRGRLRGHLRQSPQSRVRKRQRVLHPRAGTLTVDPDSRAPTTSTCSRAARRGRPATTRRSPPTSPATSTAPPASRVPRWIWAPTKTGSPLPRFRRSARSAWRCSRAGSAPRRSRRAAAGADGRGGDRLIKKPVPGSPGHRIRAAPGARELRRRSRR